MVLRQKRQLVVDRHRRRAFRPDHLELASAGLRAALDATQPPSAKPVNIRLSINNPFSPRPLDVFSAKCMPRDCANSPQRSLETDSICRP